jgi:hypothetical protein
MRTSQTLSALLGLALMAGLGYALYAVVRLGAGLFGGLDRQTTVITATAALTLLLAAWIIASGLHAIARRDEVVRRSAARAEAYQAVLRLETGAVSPVLPLGDEEESAATEQQFLLHASPAVVAAHARLRRALDSTAAREAMVELIRAMRRDLGQRAPDASPADLAALLRADERVG